MSSTPAARATAARANGDPSAPAKRPLRPGTWSESALRVLRERYLAREGKTILETPEEMCWRVAACLAHAEAKYGKTPEQVEAIAQQFYGLMVDSIFLPNSPTLMNAGKNNGLQYSACYVLPVGDSMEEIFEAVKAAAIIHKSGGGTGFAFSRLRPKDALVRSTGGKASGPVSFLRVFNGATEAVKQGGTRRGANMGILRVDHPDILEFIESKLDGGITNFNISVAITDRFMEALREDGEYDLIEPHTGAVTGRLRAGEVFDRIVQAAWKTGDPGLFFVDRCNAGRANPTPTLDKVEATNPCLGGDTLVATDRGLVRMAELAAAFAQGGIAVQVDPRMMPSRFLLFEGTHNVPVSAYDSGCLPITQAFCSGERDTIRVRTKSGLELVCTPDHRLMTTRGWVEAGTLRIGTDRLFIQSIPGSCGSDAKLPFEVTNEIRGRNGRIYRHALPTEWTRDLGLVLGFLVGDGWLRSGDKNCRVGLTFGAGNLPLLEALKGTLDRWYGRPVRSVRRSNGVHHLSYHGKFFVDFFERLGVRPVEAAAKVVPETLFRAPREAVVGFLQGLFTADGTVRENPQSNSAWIALTSKSRELLRGVQLLLLQLGIKSQIMERSRPPRAGIFPYRTRGGARRTYTSDGVLFELGIFGESRDVFRREVGFLNARQGRLEAMRYRRFYRQKFTDVVLAVEPNGVQKVYDLTEPNSHTVIANGIVAHQCGEQPLYPNEACFAPETRITTNHGLETAADLYARQQRGETVLVATNLNGQGRYIVFRPAVVVKVGVKPTVRVTLSNGQQIRVTPDHRMLTQDGWKEAGTLCREDRVCIQSGMAGPLAITSTDGDLQRMLGWFTGDGWFTDAAGLTFGPEDEVAFQRLVPIWRQFTGSAARVQTQQSTMVRCVGTERTDAIAAFKAYGFAPSRGPEKRAPKFVFTAPKEEQIRYLQGLFGADGSKTHGKPQVTLSSASLKLLREVQLLLLNLGMRSNIKYYPHRPTGRAWGQLKVNGESYHRFLDLIGFPLTPQKQERCDRFPWQRIKQDRLAVGVASVVADEEVEVYDVSEPVTHSLIAEGMIVHNCNLGSLNLAKFVKPGDTAEGIDWTGMERAIRLSVRFLDDVIEVNPYPLPEINEAVKKNRRIGLGVMGWADLLCCLGVPYDSEAALELGDRVMAFIQEKGHDESRRLAEERGPFPTWAQSIYRDKGMLRNSTVTTIAPTGTISIIADCSSGIEPLFAVAFEHRVGERRLSFVNKHFEAIAKARGFYNEALMQKVAEQGTLHGLAEVPEDVRRVFVTAHEVAPEWHVRHQAVYQRHTDNGVSKTVNLPNSATPEDVQKAYLLAYETGCIGITVFRDGCKGTQVLHVGTGAKEKKQETQAAPPAPVQPRPRVVQGVTYRTETPLGTAYITVNHNGQGEPLEVFANVGKVGSETAAVSEAIGRLISLCLRLASPVAARERVKQIVEQLAGIGGSRHLGFGKERIRSLPDAIAKVLAEHVGMIEAEEQTEAQLTLPERTGPPIKVGDPCPECGEATLAYEEGCLKCYGCGFAEC
ncbi:MAG: hypothetical protein L0214_13040 [candidate division NC10 bacterium]|nr:hypothetical protein [candidate division NC10 bacterium]